MMLKSVLAFCVASLPFLTVACAHDMGTGSQVLHDLEVSYPITVGKLVAAYRDPARRLRVYLQICRDADASGPVCAEDDLRVLAMVESTRHKFLDRLAERYLKGGKDKPVYVYGPTCEGLGEMIVVPRCQSALAIGIWDPFLRDYVVYSTLHGDSLLESEGFQGFLDLTAKATGVMRKAAKLVP